MDYPIIISSRANIFYYTGLSSSNALLIISGEQRTLITDFRYEQSAKQTGCNVEIAGKGEDVYEIALKLLEKIGSEIVVYEDYDMLACNFLKLAEKYKMLPVADEFKRCRAIKKEEEFGDMVAASKIASNAFEKVYDEIQEGVSEKSVAALLNFYMGIGGACGTSFDTIVAFGANASMPHHEPDDTALKNGDGVLIDMGAKFNGYCSDMTRTFFLGQVEEESEKIYNIVLKAQQLALDAVCEGISCKELDGIARDYITKQGYGDYFGHGLGHGVGLEIHEFPKVNAKSDDVLKAGMVITIEPGIYVPGMIGVRIEDMVLVTKDGHLNMTSTDKKLIIK